MHNSLIIKKAKLVNADLERNKFKDRAILKNSLLKELELIRCSQDNITEK